jgi:hypothetical protein
MNIKEAQNQLPLGQLQSADQTKGMFMSDQNETEDVEMFQPRKKLYRLLVEVTEEEEEAFDLLLDVNVDEEMTVDDYERYVEEQSYLENLSGWARAQRLPIVRLSAIRS